MTHETILPYFVMQLFWPLLIAIFIKHRYKRVYKKPEWCEKFAWIEPIRHDFFIISISQVENWIELGYSTVVCSKNKK